MGSKPKSSNPGLKSPPEAAHGLPGCTHIYAPAGQAGEYAPLATNPYRGCGHGCAYCYVPAVIHMTRPEFDKGAVLKPTYLAGLRKDAAKYQAAGITEQVMLSFTTDPYHPDDTAPTREVLQILKDHGLGFCTLSKGGTRALRDLDLFRSDRDAYAATLTTLDDTFSLRWERNAALPADRIETLKRFHEAGIFTWVSLEPTLDVESSLEIVRATHEFVDLFKVGRANYLKEITKTTDWKRYTEQIIELMGQLGQAHYIKKDLQSYLPPGYHNPLRVKQHHGKGEAMAKPSNPGLKSASGRSSYGYVGGTSEAELVAAAQKLFGDDQADTITKIKTVYWTIGSIIETAIAKGYCQEKGGKRAWIKEKFGKSDTHGNDCLVAWKERHDFDAALEYFCGRNDGWQPSKATGPKFAREIVKAYRERHKPPSNTTRPVSRAQQAAKAAIFWRARYQETMDEAVKIARKFNFSAPTLKRIAREAETSNPGLTTPPEAPEKPPETITTTEQLSKEIELALAELDAMRTTAVTDYKRVCEQIYDRIEWDDFDGESDYGGALDALSEKLFVPMQTRGEPIPPDVDEEAIQPIIVKGRTFLFFKDGRFETAALNPPEKPPKPVKRNQPVTTPASTRKGSGKPWTLPDNEYLRLIKMCGTNASDINLAKLERLVPDLPRHSNEYGLFEYLLTTAFKIVGSCPKYEGKQDDHEQIAWDGAVMIYMDADRRLHRAPVTTPASTRKDSGTARSGAKAGKAMIVTGKGRTIVEAVRKKGAAPNEFTIREPGTIPRTGMETTPLPKRKR